MNHPEVLLDQGEDETFPGLIPLFVGPSGFLSSSFLPRRKYPSTLTVPQLQSPNQNVGSSTRDESETTSELKGFPSYPFPFAIRHGASPILTSTIILVSLVPQLHHRELLLVKKLGPSRSWGLQETQGRVYHPQCRNGVG